MHDANGGRSTALHVTTAGLSIALFVLLARGVLAIPEAEQGVAPLIAANMAESGVKNAVTAVLLNFRAYDTFLEIGVLVLATIGVLALRTEPVAASGSIGPTADPVLSAMTRILVPLMVLTAGYLLWAGEHAPGGAFQAGSIIGAAGILLALSGYARPGWATKVALRVAIVIGFLVFLFCGLAPMLFGGQFLEYPPGLAKTLIVVIESWLTFSIGVILISMFISSATPHRHDAEEGDSS